MVESRSAALIHFSNGQTNPYPDHRFRPRRPLRGRHEGRDLGICPEARIVDISHEVAAFDIAEGAYLIAQAWRYFPKKTVHVVVVDPGVGTARRPILMEAGGHYFVAPG